MPTASTKVCQVCNTAFTRAYDGLCSNCRGIGRERVRDKGILNWREPLRRWYYSIPKELRYPYVWNAVNTALNQLQDEAIELGEN